MKRMLFYVVILTMLVISACVSQKNMCEKVHNPKSFIGY